MTAPRARAPHCDELVLHAPGSCRFCDWYPDAQIARAATNVLFTGEPPREGWEPCPSEARRPVEIIHRWPGNAPSGWPRDESGEPVRATAPRGGIRYPNAPTSAPKHDDDGHGGAFPVCGLPYRIYGDEWRSCTRPPTHMGVQPHGYWFPNLDGSPLVWCRSCSRVLCECTFTPPVNTDPPAPFTLPAGSVEEFTPDQWNATLNRTRRTGSNLIGAGPCIDDAPNPAFAPSSWTPHPEDEPLYGGWAYKRCKSRLEDGTRCALRQRHSSLYHQTRPRRGEVKRWDEPTVDLDRP